jgi:activator of 2-hydroxyglutaryl-CoA dehydratase
MVEALKRTINRSVNVSKEPDTVAALGAALLAHQRVQKLGGIPEPESYVFG